MAAPRNENLKQKILDAACALLRTTSFESVTLAQIAGAAGVSKGTLYYYYSSKEDILFDIGDRYLSGLMDELLAWADNREKDTSLPRLLKYVLERGAGDEFGNLRLYLIGAGVSGQDALRRRYVELYGQFQSTLAQRLAQRAPGMDAQFAAWLLLVLTDGVLVQKRLANPQFDCEAFQAQAAGLLRLLARQGAAADEG